MVKNIKAELYQITGLTVEMDPRYPTVCKQAESYRLKDGNENSTEADMRIHLTEEFLRERQQENPHLSMDECEYIWYGASFYNQLVNFDGVLLHSSAIEYEGKAYLFSAPSGTGKSTHTMLWKRCFGEKVVRYINDDKPALRVENGVVYAYGTPFSGKTDQNRNVKVPVQGICFLERGKENEIRPLTGKEAILPFMNQTLRPSDEKSMEQVLTTLDTIVRNVSFYRMKCNMSLEAPRVSWEGMRD